MPGIGSTWTPFWNCAVRPEVAAIVRLAWVLAVTAELVCEVAVTVRFREPGTAKLTALVVIGTTCEAPAASVTEVDAQARHQRRRAGQGEVEGVRGAAGVGHGELEGRAGSAGGRVQGNADPGGQDVERAVADEPETDGRVVEVAVTVKGRSPTAVPGARGERQGHVAEVAGAGGNVDGVLARSWP